MIRKGEKINEINGDFHGKSLGQWARIKSQRNVSGLVQCVRVCGGGGWPANRGTRGTGAKNSETWKINKIYNKSWKK